MFERFTFAAHQVLEAAVNATGDAVLVDTESLVLGLSSVNGMAEYALRSCGIGTGAMQAALADRIGSLPPRTKGDRPEFSPVTQAILEDAIREADALRQEAVGTGHVLLALLRQADASDGKLVASILVHQVRIRRFVTTALVEQGPRGSEEAPEQPSVRLSSLLAEIPKGARERSQLAELGITPAIILQMEEADPTPLVASRGQLAELASRRTGTTAGEVDVLVEALTHEPVARAMISRTGITPDLVIAHLLLHHGECLPTMSRAWSLSAVLGRFVGPVLQLVAAGLVIRGAINGPWWMWLLLPLCGLAYPSAPVWVGLAVAGGVALVEPPAGVALLGSGLAGAVASVLDRVVLLSTTGSEVPRRDRVFLEFIVGRTARVARVLRLYRRLGFPGAQAMLRTEEPEDWPDYAEGPGILNHSEAVDTPLQEAPDVEDSPVATPQTRRHISNDGRAPKPLRIISTLTAVLLLVLIVLTAVDRDWPSLLGFVSLLLLHMYGRVLFIIVAGGVAWLAGLPFVAAMSVALVPLWGASQVAAATRTARGVSEGVLLERLEQVAGAGSVIKGERGRPLTTLDLGRHDAGEIAIGFDGPLVGNGSLSWCAAEALILGDLARQGQSPDLSLFDAAARLAPLLPLSALQRATVDTPVADDWARSALLDFMSGEPALDDVGRRMVVMVDRPAPESDAAADTLWHTPTSHTLFKLLSPRFVPWVTP